MKSKLSYFVLLSSMLFTVASCGDSKDSASSGDAGSATSNETVDSTTSALFEIAYEKGEDDKIYAAAYGDYADLVAAAREMTDNDSQRFVAYADAEAYLLNQATFVPTTTNGGNFAITRVAPRTVANVQYGVDNYRMHKTIISNNWITTDEREEMIALWDAARVAGTDTYDPAAYLTGKGHTLSNQYSGTYTADPNTFDVQSSSRTVDVEYTVNTIDGLVEVDKYGRIQPSIASSWDVSEDGKTYTFHLRNDAKWYSQSGSEYAAVTADDFVAGIQHSIDSGGPSYLLDGVVVGATDYIYGDEVSFSGVGVKAVDDHTLQIQLENKTPYFLTMLSYSVFLPMNRAYYTSKGGAFGLEAYATASASTSYTYGKTRNDILSNGPYLFSRYDESSIMEFTRNANYWDNSSTTLNTLRFTYTDGSDLLTIYNDAKNNQYSGLGVGTTLMTQVKEDGLFDDYAYITQTDSTTFIGSFNLNRQTYDDSKGGYVSAITDAADRERTFNAFQNVHFRRAVAAAWDRSSWNAISVGDELKDYSIRNMYTYPELCSLTEDVTVDGHTFTSGTIYGDLVQWFLTNKYDSHIIVADGADGWYDETVAKAEMAQAQAELASYVSGGKVKMEVHYPSVSTSMTAQATAFEAAIESVLGDYIDVVLTGCQPNPYYFSGYYCERGEDMNYDFFYGSGWGPDYGDPYSYLETFLEGSYMVMTNGLD